MPGTACDAPTTLLAKLRRTRGLPSGERPAALSAIGVRTITGGLQNEIYRYTAPDETDVIIKIYNRTDRRRVEREWAALNVLAPHGLPVPVPLWADPAPDGPAIGMTALRGQPLLDNPDLLAALRDLADTTARLHAVPMTGLLASLPRVDSGEHYLLRLTLAWPDLLANAPSDPLTADMWRLLARWQRCGDADLVLQSAGRVLSRGDGNLLNWLSTDRGAGCVDFEYAGFSDRTFDVADLVEQVSGRAVPDATWAQLLPDLGVTDTHRHRFAACQRTVALRWLAILWKQKARRRDEFAAQHERVAMLFSRANPYT